jgi:flagellar motor switch/type III secretory pathway protein FliN
MNKPTWPRLRARENAALRDPAPAILTRLAQQIEACSVEVMRGRASVSHEAPTRDARVPSDRGDAQTWHSDIGDGVDVWCTIDGTAARALLEIVLGGPGAAKPTSLERGIVRETVERVLSSTSRVWEERTEARFPSTSGWLCRVTIAAACGNPAELCFYAPAADEPPAPIVQRVDLRGVPVTLTASLPPAGVRVRSIAGWRLGAIVTLGCDAESAVDLFAGSACVASGLLGAVRDRRAVRIDRCAREPRS